MSNSDNTPLVSVVCITFNHAPYIADALKSFIAQQTDFPFEIIVHDDASTDGTADIIREYHERYPGLIRPVLQQENQYSQHHCFDRIIHGAVDMARGKYIAYCEGDDFWTDSCKLQLQADFLNANPDYGMCYGRVDCLSQKQMQVVRQFGGPSEDFNALLIENCVPTCTAMFRRKLYLQYFDDIKPCGRGWKMSDMPMWLYMSHSFRIKFFNRILATYRELEESAVHSADPQKRLSTDRSYYEIKKHFFKLYSPGSLALMNEIEERYAIALFNICNHYGLKYDIVSDQLRNIESPSRRIRMIRLYVGYPFLRPVLRFIRSMKKRILHH